MKSVFLLLLFFLGIGVFARSYNCWVRLLLGVGIVGMLLLFYLLLFLNLSGE
ncbi:MAG: hypothetical protein IMW89_14275 [Ktedonobacteraceae bacterium]|nr:hypothetical protein [Ktedonobacteraceae bacterium]